MAAPAFRESRSGFYTYSLDRYVWSVRTGERLKWPLQRKTVSIDEILPSMQTDVILENRSEGLLIIIDMKFTEIVHPGWHRANSLKSGYLYQIYTYLRSQEKIADALSFSSTGALLHPAIGENYDESIELQGHTLRFLTVDQSSQGHRATKQLFFLPDVSHPVLALLFGTPGYKPAISSSFSTLQIANKC